MDQSGEEIHGGVETVQEALLTTHALRRYHRQKSLEMQLSLARRRF